MVKRFECVCNREYRSYSSSKAWAREEAGKERYCSVVIIRKKKGKWRFGLIVNKGM